MGKAVTHPGKSLIALGLAACLAAVPAFAHHSFSMFKPTTVTLTGTVKSWQWTNPHCFLELMVTNPSTNKLEEWSIEGGAVSMLYREGWTYHSLNPGDQATVVMQPLKNGANGGSMVKVSVNGKWIGTQRDRPTVRRVG